jgi:aryl-alcohol dehydrogenase-like predicted oxidoreductase
MKYIKFGKVDILVSRIGLGGHQFEWTFSGNVNNGEYLRHNPERNEVVKKAIDGGINYFDTGFREEIQSLGYVLHNLGINRDKVYITAVILDPLKQCAGLTFKEMRTVIKKDVEDKLKLAFTDYFDFYNVCNISSGFDIQRIHQVVEIYNELRKEGKIRYINVSGHKYSEFIEMFASGVDLDVITLVYNYPIYRGIASFGHTDVNMKEKETLFQIIKEKNLGIVAIKPLAWYIRAIPFSSLTHGEEAQELIRNLISWMASDSEAHTTVIGIDHTYQIDTIMAGVKKTTYDPAMLDSMIIKLNAKKEPLALYMDHFGELDEYTQFKLLYISEEIRKGKKLF